MWGEEGSEQNQRAQGRVILFNGIVTWMVFKLSICQVGKLSQGDCRSL